jgi:hypothetical protein
LQNFLIREISTEDLVSAVARENNLDVVLNMLAQEKAHEGRDDGMRFSVVLDRDGKKVE